MTPQCVGCSKQRSIWIGCDTKMEVNSCGEVDGLEMVKYI